MKLPAITLAALLFAGCATSEKFAAKMDAFIGQPESALVSRLGPPQSAYTLTDGSKVIQYARSSTMLIPGATTLQPVRSNTYGNVSLNQGLRTTSGTYSSTTTTYVQHQGPSTSVQLACTVNFTISAQGAVLAWTAEGNHCKSK